MYIKREREKDRGRDKNITESQNNTHGFGLLKSL